MMDLRAVERPTRPTKARFLWKQVKQRSMDKTMTQDKTSPESKPKSNPASAQDGTDPSSPAPKAEKETLSKEEQMARFEDALKDEDKALPWLLTILRRTVYREQRCQYRNQETLNTLKQLDLEETQSDAFTLLEIYDALEYLSPKLRDTFLLHHLHGLSYEEISAQLEIPTGTVMSRISRAREALQKQQNTDSEKVIDFRSIKRGSSDEG